MDTRPTFIEVPAERSINKQVRYINIDHIIGIDLFEFKDDGKINYYLVIIITNVSDSSRHDFSKERVTIGIFDSSTARDDYLIKLNLNIIKLDIKR